LEDIRLTKDKFVVSSFFRKSNFDKMQQTERCGGLPMRKMELMGVLKIVKPLANLIVY